MQRFATVRTRVGTMTAPAALAVVAVHLAISSLFYMESALGERLTLAALVVLVLGFAAHAYGGLARSWRGVIGLSVGLPATMFGLGVHASHVYQIGFATSDYTGIPMLVAGILLTVIGGTAIVRAVHTWWRRLVFIPIVPILAFFVIFPAGLGVFAANVVRVPCCDETPADYGYTYEDMSFETEAGLELSAWYIPTQNGAVIITVHGAGNNRATVMDHAILLARHGYGVLMLDLEGFGNSEGRGNAFGWVGARGVHAAIEYLRGRSDIDPERIGGVGYSMGGEVLLQAAGESPHLKAVVSEGGTGRTAADFAELDDGWFEVIVPFHWVVGSTMRLISGESAPPPLRQMVQQIGPRSVLLIAANISEETELMSLYVAVGGPSFEMWTIPEPKHVGALKLHPEEYEQRVVSFFDEALLGIERGPDPLANPIP